jgi:hypothetical protein
MRWAGRRERTPGEKLRGRLNWLILKTLAVDIGAPIVLGDMVQFLYVISSRSLLQAYYRSQRRSLFTTYLYRLAERGYVKLEGLRRERRATLTPAGRRALQALETWMELSGQREALTSVPDLRERLEAIRRERQARIAPAAVLRRMERQRQALRQSIPGIPRATAFVSYDLPRGEDNRRRLLIGVLRGHGFKRLHQSMYVGPSERLRGALETLETAGVLSYLRWGTLTVYSP